MANRIFSQFQGSLEKGVVHLFAKVAIGASGAPTISAANSKGISGIVRNSAGDYTLTLQDTYNKLLGMQGSFIVSTGLPAAPVVGLKTLAVGTVGAATIRFVCSTGGVATDPASGETMYLRITLSNSNAL